MDQLLSLPTLANFENDGRRVLVQLIGLSAWRSLDQALASLTVFAHPDAVGSVGTRAVFRTIRGRPKGTIIGDAMLDDNASPATAFEWATGFKRGPDLQCNHLSAAARDPASYSDLRNICYTPTFIAKLTDSQRKDVSEGHLSHLLRFRAFELYGYAGPQGSPHPRKPSGYDDLPGLARSHRRRDDGRGRRRHLPQEHGTASEGPPGEGGPVHRLDFLGLPSGRDGDLPGLLGGSVVSATARSPMIRSTRLRGSGNRCRFTRPVAVATSQFLIRRMYSDMLIVT